MKEFKKMKYYEIAFITILLDGGALRLKNPDDPEGLFTLKSGRRSPFFMNLGQLNSGNELNQIGDAYASAAFQYFGEDIDIFFGPAYKGIPLATATSMRYDQYATRRNTHYCSNRKEIKDHGDSGILLGAKPKDGNKVVIVEDVTTSGKSIDETIPILRAEADVDIKGLIVAFNRLEYGHDKTKTALEEVAEKYDIETHAIVDMEDVLTYLSHEGELSPETLRKFQDYYAQYGPEGRNIC